MKFKINRETLLKPLQQVATVASGRPALPILGNLCFDASVNGLKITGTDLELELVADITDCEILEAGATTIPCRKVSDIVKSLPADSMLTFTLKENNVIVTCGRSRYKLSTLPATEYPNTELAQAIFKVQLQKKTLKNIFQKASVAMANQDVRYFLNGVYLEASENSITCVGTDGHRLAAATAATTHPVENGGKVIVPRKSVTEIIKLVDSSEEDVTLVISNHSLTLQLGSLQLTSKLIDGKYPDYRRVIPRDANNITLVERKELLNRIKLAMILSNEKFRTVAFTYSNQGVTLESKNPEQEEAIEHLDVTSYEGEDSLKVGYNGNYMIDALNSLTGDKIRIRQGSPNSSCIIEDEDNSDAFYILMPVRL